MWTKLLVHVVLLLEIIAVVREVAGGRRQRGSSIDSLRERESRAGRETRARGSDLREKQKYCVCAAGKIILRNL